MAMNEVQAWAKDYLMRYRDELETIWSDQLRVQELEDACSNIAAAPTDKNMVRIIDKNTGKYAINGNNEILHTHLFVQQQRNPAANEDRLAALIDLRALVDLKIKKADALCMGLRAEIWESMSGFHARVLTGYFCDCMTFRLIGKKIGLSESRISQIYDEGLQLFADVHDEVQQSPAAMQWLKKMIWQSEEVS